MTEQWEDEGGALQRLGRQGPGPAALRADRAIASIQKWIDEKLGWDPENRPEFDPGPETPIDLERQRVFTETYQASLEAANVDALATWRLDTLASNQHVGHLATFIASLEGKPRVLNLVLGGRVGSGKTSASIAAGWAAVEAGMMVRFVRHGTYLAMLRPDGSPVDQSAWQIRRRYRLPGLLILDDLAAELDTGEASRFVREETLSLIGDRINKGLATIFTTNETSEAIAAMLGQRTYSRISERGAALTFKGDDKRGHLTW